jgi:hypothetical protein
LRIPRILHQLWADSNIPPRYALLQETWRRHHPDWEFRLWTDRDLLSLVERRYPELAAIFRDYRMNICRADLGRYLVLDNVGGVYADMDCECLRPVTPLLDGHGIVFGLEPEQHLAAPLVVERGLGKIVCASFIASVPEHDFWRHVLDHIRAAAKMPGPLDATGPFMLTRAYESYSAPGSVTLLPARQVYPITSDESWSGQAHDIEFWEGATRDAHVVHYWDGTWFQDIGDVRGLPSTFPMVIRKDAAPARVSYPNWTEGPTISCIMVVEGGSTAAKTALECFVRQTYANRELVVVAPARRRPLLRDLALLGGAGIKLVEVHGVTTRAGMQALGLERAAGPLACCWEPDDLHDERRLEVQYEALRQTGADACLMRRALRWSPAARRVAVGPSSAPMTSMLALTRVVSRPAAATGQMVGFAPLPGDVRVVVCDLPRLYIQRSRGADIDWQSSDAIFEGERYDAVVGELAKRLPMEDYQPIDGAASVIPQSATLPSVLVLTPIKNARRHVQRLCELLGRLDYDRAALSVAFLEGDSTDGTYEALHEALPGLRQRCARVELFRHHHGLQLTGDRSAPKVQRRRREVIARARNRLVSQALRDEAWVLWLDADLVDYPPDLLRRLLAAGKRIVAAHCLLPNGATFDLNTFRFSVASGGRDDARYIIDGLFQPPRGANRLYLDAFRAETLVPVDGVGGTALLVHADLHREGLSFPPFPYRGYIETEGLAMMAKDMGEQCWAMPRLKIVHAAE